MRLLLMIALAPASLLAQASAPADPLDALVRDSPFLPGSGGSPTAPAGEAGPLEFRSVVFERGQFAFSIYDQASREARWIKLDERDAPFVARSYDRENDILTVEHQGRSLALKLQPGHVEGQAQASPTGTPSPLPSAAETARQSGSRPPNTNPAPGGPAVAPAPGSPQESQRLQDMSDEIRRRRQQSPMALPKN